MVESKRSKEVYALKIRKKARIFPTNQAATTLIYFENFFEERNIHLKANHLTNYVAKLLATFQNNVINLKFLVQFHFVLILIKINHFSRTYFTLCDSKLAEV